MRYQQLQKEAQALVQKLMEIEDEKKENELVLESISQLEDSRKCWRLVNGVLMEKTKVEVVPEMRVVINNLNILYLLNICWMISYSFLWLNRFYDWTRFKCFSFPYELI